jgi:transposase
MGKTTKRRYNSEFKQQAAELASRIGVHQTARQLGVAVSSVHHWKKNADTKEPQSKKEKVNLEEENRRLQKEVDELKKVNQILKKAAAFFSQDHLK